MSSMLSQEEIDAMLNGGGSPVSGFDAGNLDILDDQEKDILGEIGNICMGGSATTLFTLLNKRVDITTPRVTVIRPSEVLARYDIPFVAVDISYTEGVDGRNLLLLKEPDVLMITDLLMGGEGQVDPDTEVGELQLSAISEIMNQMMGASATALSELLGISTNISPPHAMRVGESNSNISELMGDDSPVVKVSFDMEIEGILNSELMQIIPIPFAKQLVNMLLQSQSGNSKPASASAPSPAPVAVPAPAPVRESAAPAKQVNVKSIQYQSFDAPAPVGAAVSTDKLNLISDVPMQVTVELGKTRKSIQEILGFGMGSIIVLEKASGEPVDVLVNGKLIARGEVVVIDENYGVRITDIVPPNATVLKYN